MALRLNAIALLVAACGLTLAACQAPHAPRQLLAAQSFGSVEPPKQPKTVTRAEWGPRFTSLGNTLGGGNKKLLAFLAPQQPNKPADVKASRFAPKATSASTADSPGRKLHAAQSFGSVEAPKQPKAATRAQWGPKFTSLGGNKKLLAFLAPQQPNKPADVKASRFAPKATSASTADSPGRKLHAAQSFGSVEAPKQPKAATRAQWGPKFTSLGGNKKLLAFLAPQQPNKPADVKASRFAPKATSASTTDSPGRKLHAAQSFGSVEAPKQPKAATRAEWGPKFTSLGGNKKLLAFLAPQQPNKPADVKASRFAPKATSADSPGRHLLAAQAAGATQAPKQPNAVVRKDWGPKFPAAAADGDRK